MSPGSTLISRLVSVIIAVASFPAARTNLVQYLSSDSVFIGLYVIDYSGSRPVLGDRLHSAYRTTEGTHHEAARCITCETISNTVARCLQPTLRQELTEHTVDYLWDEPLDLVFVAPSSGITAVPIIPWMPRTLPKQHCPAFPINITAGHHTESNVPTSHGIFSGSI